MTRAPSDSDPFFQLLTEALRAGPGSAQWGEAMTKLRDGGVEGADEYRLIIRAREDLEKGRDFRRVTAGPGFTRKVLEAVEQEGGRRRNGIPTATLVAILAGAVILGVVVTVIVIASRGGGSTDPQQAAIERLEATSMPVSVASLSAGTGLKTIAPTTQPAKMSLAVLMTTQPIDPASSAAADLEIVLPAEGAAQLIVSDSPDGSSAREVALSWRNGRVSVDIAGMAGEPTALGTAAGTLTASIRFDRDNAIVEAAGRRLFAGPHRLGDEPRYVGVRMIQSRDGGKPAQIKSLSVARAAPAEGR